MRRSEIRKQLRIRARNIIVQRDRRFFVNIEKENLKRLMRRLMQMKNYTHLSMITALEVGSMIEVIYHVAFTDALVSVKVQTPKDEPIIPSIIDLIPGAALYEREIHDFFGVEFEGNPDLSPLLLPDGWPEGVYPLRKWWSADRILSKLGGRR
ncbi:TPA: NADH-quinone oxidoreductase subunit C [Candidatus Bathyarchaeota archaeon]|nr:NADH-quinone oxidoreductase subunit C [Candidatus Bathyarchaeota archaeon]